MFKISIINIKFYNSFRNIILLSNNINDSKIELSLMKNNSSENDIFYLLIYF